MGVLWVPPRKMMLVTVTAKICHQPCEHLVVWFWDGPHSFGIECTSSKIWRASRRVTDLTRTTSKTIPGTWGHLLDLSEGTGGKQIKRTHACDDITTVGENMEIHCFQIKLKSQNGEIHKGKTKTDLSLRWQGGNQGHKVNITTEKLEG